MINMKFISHRGNILGKNPEKENTLEYIYSAIDRGFDVEIDLWFKDETFYLGHDVPTHKVKLSEIQHPNLWIHAKNLEALRLTSKILNTFYHTDEDYVLTSRGYIWTYPGKKLNSECICVLPETVNYEFEEILLSNGICSDYIASYRNMFPCYQ